ncbi:MAG TPA: hypothetical protein VHZ29_11465 [Rhizomicrobium sp.]|nr:hypothetical protein [Rhizomicrobium sp.]
MRTVLKSAAFGVAILAMMLRAVQPQGWMPNPQSETAHNAPIMLCPGMAMPVAPAQKPDHGHTKITFCACAAAAPLSTSMACALSVSPSPLAGTLAFAVTTDVAVRATSYRPNSARAPPAFV